MDVIPLPGWTSCSRLCGGHGTRIGIKFGDARVLQLSVVVGDLVIDDGGSRAVAGAINDGCYGCCYDGIKLIYVCLV